MEDSRPSSLWLRGGLRRISQIKFHTLLIAAIVIVVPVTTAAWALVPEQFVILTVYAERTVYASGESVHIHASLVNCGCKAVELTYPTGGIIFIDIYDSSGRLVFFAPKDVTMAIMEITLGPMETLEREFIWDMEDRAGEEVSLPGTFLIVATSSSYEASYFAHAVPVCISS